MKMWYINRQRKRFLAYWLVGVLIFAQATYVLASIPVETELLNDRAADIIGSSPLQIPGLLIPEGLTGKGVVVGMADSGLDKGSLTDLPVDLQSPSGRIPRVVMLKSFSGRELPDDPIGHGTHMAGTIVGSGESSGGQFKGIAPGASLYFQALLDREGNISIPADLKTLFLPAYLAGVRVHVDGWGEAGNSYDFRSAQIDQFIDAHPDFIAVFGAGNKGSGRATLTNEATSKNALTVGSSQLPRPVFSPEALYADQVAGSSSRGPTSDGRIKPELLAPGSAVISVCSSLMASNYTANTAYTRMGGSSMAAAVSGGALALLEEYLKTQKGIASPSAALLKALLINGARAAKDSPSEQIGFGILDLAGTILPLQEDSFQTADIKESLHDGQVLEYRFKVSDISRPFKTTLAWTDPVADAGSTSQLVDNLNLEVVDPMGKVLLGNDFKGQGVSDSKNNVEQICIEKPLPGEYLIRIKASRIVGDLSGDHIGLVYGQAMRHEIVKTIEGSSLFFASGGKVDLKDQYNIKSAVNGRQLSSQGESVAPGSDLYIGFRTIYCFSRIWDSGGVQLLTEPQGTLLVEINPQVRQGGYFLEERPSPNALVLNGNIMKTGEDIPAGVKVRADINPGLQTIWALDASFKSVQGVLEYLEQDKRQCKLINDPQVYQLAAWTAVSSDEKMLASTEADTPYGSFNTYGLESLTPSSSVLMMVSSNNEVQSIRVERNTVVGNVAAVDAAGQGIILEDGKKYASFPGAKIYRNGQQTSLKELKPGDKVSACLLGTSHTFLQLQVYSVVEYGRIVYVNTSQKKLYLFDSHNNFKILNYSNESQIFQGGLHLDAGSLGPGDWIRLELDPASQTILRMDLAAKKQEDAMKYFKSYDSQRQTIMMSDGSSYQYGSTTQMSKGGFVFSPDLLCPGEKLKITTLVCPGSDREYLARVEAAVPPGAAPVLQAEVSQLNGVLVIRGYTTGNKIVVFREDGTRHDLEVNGDGSFSGLFSLTPGELKVQVLAVDLRQGGIAGVEREITFMGQGQQNRPFVDIEQNPDRDSIEALAFRGVVGGIGGGHFAPEQPVNRSEFLTMLGQARGWHLDKSEKVSYFKDNGQIPWWALSSVYFARQRGIICGYPDKRFGPLETLTRSEMTVILGRTLIAGDNFNTIGKRSLPFADTGDIPLWASTYYSLFYDKGWLELFGRELHPDRPVNRAEAARFILHILFPASSPGN